MFISFAETFSTIYLANIIAIIGANPKDALSPAVWENLGIYTLITISTLVVGIVDYYLLTHVKIRYQKYLYDYLFCHVHKHSAAFLTYWQTGFILNKVNNILSQFGIFFALIRDWFPRTIVFYISVAVILFNISIPLGTILFAIQLTGVFLFYLLSRRLKVFIKDMQSKISATAGLIVDSIANARLVKYTAAFFHEKHTLCQYQDAAIRSSLIAAKENGQTDFTNTLIRLFSFTLSFLTILYFYDLYDLSLRDVVLCATFTFSLTSRAADVAHNVTEFQNILGKLEDAIELLWKPFEVVDIPNAKALKMDTNTIEFKNVRFSYKKGVHLFKNLNISIAANQKVGLVGISGSGKSTLINLLLRAYDVHGGKILISNQDIAKVTLFSLHRNISLISQEPCLFNRSILENIRYAKPKASMEDVIRAAKLAHIHDRIMHLPNGYDSIVGERGIKLSGGERQRVSIAAAILKDAPILILDEATSALDSESELAIEKALKNVMKNKTVIAIAHRLSTLKNMDKIIVLDKGEVKETGTQSELLKRKDGIFSHLYKLQTDGYLQA
jgi:ATP-binding cassette subfamily B protein